MIILTQIINATDISPYFYDTTDYCINDIGDLIYINNSKSYFNTSDDDKFYV
jgi:hypothetical protein